VYDDSSLDIFQMIEKNIKPTKKACQEGTLGFLTLSGGCEGD